MAVRLATEEDLRNPNYKYMYPGVGPESLSSNLSINLMDQLNGLQYDPSNKEGYGYYTDITPGATEAQRKAAIANVMKFDYERGELPGNLQNTWTPPLAPNQANSDTGDFTKTAMDDYYSNLLKGIVGQPGTDFSQVNQPLADYQKYAAGMDGNAIPQAYTDLVKGVGSKSEGQFQDYLKMLQTPTSAEEAIKATEGDILTQTLRDIDSEIAKSVADIKLTGEEYGISGAGRLSEPIAAAMAGVQGQGLRQKAGAQSQLALNQLNRQAEKDQELRQAYKARYERGPVEELMLAQAYPQFAQLQQNDKELMYKMASSEADRRLQGLQLSSNEKQNLVDNLFKTMLTGLELQSRENIAGGEFDLKKFLQDQQITWDKAKTAETFNQQQAAANKQQSFQQLMNQQNQEFEQRKIDNEPGFWESLGQNTLSGLVGGFTGGVGTGIANTLFKEKK